MKSNSELTQIKNASFFKRIIAFIMDGVLAIFIMIGFIALVFLPISNKAFKYKENQADYLLYELASNLVVVSAVDEEGNQKIYSINELDTVPSNCNYLLISEVNGYEDEFYINHVKYYYLNYKTGVNVEYPENANPEDYKAPNYQELIEGKTRSEYYTEEWFNEQVTSSGSISNLITTALNDLSNEDYFISKLHSIRLTKYFIYFPAFFLSFSVFFIVIPLCFKNGETLAKKTLHLSFINNAGYAVLKKQIVLRQLFLFIINAMIVFMYVRVGAVALAFLGIGIVIYYVATVINKEKKSPADLLAMTLLVDANKSVWFKNAKVEQEKEEILEKNMENYQKNKVENPHVIQVGGTIVNEEIKKEIEEENNKKDE